MAASVEFDIYARDRASRTFNDVGRSADRTSDRMRRLGRGVRVAGAAMAVGLGAAAVGAYKLAKAASEDEAAAKKLALALRNNAGATKTQIAATEDWITAQGKALGVSDDELRPALGRLVTATKDVGKAQSLARLAMNASAGTGKSLEQVSTALMKAQNGQVSSLSRLGINVKDAEGKTVSFTEATRRMSEMFRGQAASAADTTAGRFARLKLMVSEAGESFGAKLLPPATKFAGWMLSTGVPALSRFNEWLSAKVGPSLTAFGGFIQNSVIPAARSFSDWFGNKIAPILADLYQTRIKQVVSAFGSLKGSVRDNEPELRKFGAWLKKGAEIAAQVLGPALKFLGGVQVKALTTGFRVAVTALSAWVDWASTVGGAARRVGGWISDMAGKVVAGGRSFGQLASAAAEKINALLDKVRAIPGRITGAIGDLGRLLYGAGAAVIQGLIDGIQSKISSLTSKLSSITKLIPNKKGPIDKDRVLLQPAGVAIMKGLIDGIEKGRKPLELVLEKITGKVKSTREKLKNLKQQRADFASGFQFGESIFATPDSEVTSTDAEGNAVTTSVAPTLASMKAFAAAQRAQAAQLNADVKSLVGKGLSVSLIKQMQSQGASGIAQIRALAGGSAADIAEFNALDKDTRSLYQEAGMTAADPLFTKPIEDAEKDAKQAKLLAAEIAAVIKDATRKEMERLEFRLEGRTLVAVLKKEKRENGGKNLGLA